MTALTVIENTAKVDAYRVSTDAAMICKDIVVATATTIQGRKYVNVEGWQAIAIAHGCAASARDVERIEGGVRAIGEIRRMSDGALISQAEGFVGEDEETWYGGTSRWGKPMPKRADYAIRAMAQTRAISRACRSAFAHVVVMMGAGLATTPAEEVPQGGFQDGPEPTRNVTPEPENSKRQPPLVGPIKTRAAVRIAYGNFCRELEACADDQMLDSLLAAEKPLIDQIRDEAPFIRDGDGSDFLGLEREIERRRQLIALEEADDSWKTDVTRAG